MSFSSPSAEAGEALPDAMPDGLLALGDCTDGSVAAVLGTPHPGTITMLDLSHGMLSALPGLDHPQWTSLTTLVCDHNHLESVAGWPAIDGLQTLSLNANHVDDLDALLSDIAARFPRLTYLSLLGNPCCPSETHGGNEASYASYQRMVGKRLPQLHFLDFKRLRPDPPRDSPTLSRSAMALARIKSLGSRKSPLFSSPPSPGPGPVERRFQLSSALSESDFGVDAVDDCPSKPPSHESIIGITTAKLDAQLINQAEFDHIIAVMKSADVVDDDDAGLAAPAHHTDVSSLEKPTVKAPRGFTTVKAPRGFTVKAPRGFTSDREFAHILATIEADQEPPVSPEDAENELLVVRLAAADQLLKEEADELARQERRSAIERRERALYPEPPMKNAVDDTATTDRFSEQMKHEGLAHVTADGTNVSLTFDQLPQELDLTQL